MSTRNFILTYCVFVLFLSTKAQTFQKTYGTANQEYGSYIALLKNGSYLVTSYGTDIGPTLEDIWILKIASNGDTLWTKYYHINKGDKERVGQAIQTKDGNYVVCGSTEQRNNFTTDDSFLMKLDTTGKIIWKNTYGLNSDYYSYNASEVAEQADSSFILGGSFTDGFRSDGYFLHTDKKGIQLNNSTYGLPTGFSGGTGFCGMIPYQNNYFAIGFSTYLGAISNSYLFKLNNKGEKIWEKNYSSAKAVATDLAIGPNNHLFIIARNDTLNACYLHELDTAGNMIKETKYDSVHCSAMKIYNDGVVIITGNDGKKNSDALLLKTNINSAVPQWRKTYGGLGNEDFLNFVDTKDGWALLGSTSSFGKGSNDVYLVNTDKEGNSASNLVNIILPKDPTYICSDSTYEILAQASGNFAPTNKFRIKIEKYTGSSPSLVLASDTTYEIGNLSNPISFRISKSNDISAIKYSILSSMPEFSVSSGFIYLRQTNEIVSNLIQTSGFCLGDSASFSANSININTGIDVTSSTVLNLKYSFYVDGQLVPNTTNFFDKRKKVVDKEGAVVILKSQVTGCFKPIKNDTVITKWMTYAASRKASLSLITQDSICEGNPIKIVINASHWGRGGSLVFQINNKAAKTLYYPDTVFTTSDLKQKDSVNATIYSFGCFDKANETTKAVYPLLKKSPAPELTPAGTTLAACESSSDGNNRSLSSLATTAKTFQWYWNDQPIEGSTAKSISGYPKSGSYYCLLSDGKCSRKSNAVTVTVGIVPKVTLTGESSICKIIGNTHSINVSDLAGTITSWKITNNGPLLYNSTPYPSSNSYTLVPYDTNYTSMTHTLIVKGTGSCYDVTKKFTFNLMKQPCITGLEDNIDISDSEHFTFYPNPATGNEVFLNKVANVQIRNSNGQMVKEIRDAYKIDISKLESGVYILSNQNGKHQKLVIE